MTALFAHHVEPGFLPIYAGQFALGVWVGWRLAAAVLRRLAA
ncbi:MAG TPA: hypothetical protein VG125_27575 [Pirellulales bacterium]|jgi:hypothetical protein|nr:hypothetical protein [Pirellulales bacterium]